MKKVIFISLFAVIFVCAQAFATVVTERKIYKQTPAANSMSQPPVVTRSKEKMSNAIKNCTPYHEHLDSDYLGMNVDFDLRIQGWVNNKCVMNFNANTSGASSSFNRMYGVEPSQAEIFAFAPKIRCEFTQKQLEYVGDSILQEQERSVGNVSMLKDPNSISITNFSSSDMRLLDVVMRQGACVLLNVPDLDNVLQMLY